MTALHKAIPENATSLVIPIPPTTADQIAIGMTTPCCWEKSECSAVNVPQSALFVKATEGLLTGTYTYDVAIPTGRVAEAHFLPHAIKSLEPTLDAHTLFETSGFTRIEDENERLDAIIECIAHKYEYAHGVNSELALTCDLLTGNCLDINAAFIKLLRLGNIKNAYYIGYFFPEGKPLVNDDWHCWVDTMSARGYENWDIAHYLKRGILKIDPALNPIAGIRFAMSTGRDLAFDTPYGRVTMPHLCEPRWALADGTTRQCEISVTAVPVQACTNVN